MRLKKIVIQALNRMQLTRYSIIENETNLIDSN